MDSFPSHLPEAPWQKLIKEADYLYQRIQQEFFMGAKPQYSGV
jgi:hypothetical protein